MVPFICIICFKAQKRGKSDFLVRFQTLCLINFQVTKFSIPKKWLDGAIERVKQVSKLFIEGAKRVSNVLLLKDYCIIS